jgi:hypothetical protein
MAEQFLAFAVEKYLAGNEHYFVLFGDLFVDADVEQLNFYFAFEFFLQPFDDGFHVLALHAFSGAEFVKGNFMPVDEIERFLVEFHFGGSQSNGNGVFYEPFSGSDLQIGGRQKARFGRSGGTRGICRNRDGRNILSVKN